MEGQFDISVILCTYNRCDLLKQALASLLRQDCGAGRYEVIVVDNNSSDKTREICESYVAESPVPVRYIFEPRQGVSYARNTAIAAARAPILAFTDDDVVVSGNWISSLKKAMDEHPEVCGIGGKVISQDNRKFPDWLTHEQWCVLALQDYGDAPLRLTADKPLCLVTANLALRRCVFEQIGMFSLTLQRIKDGIGSAEDHELHLRIYEANLQQLYLPEIVVTTEVPPERLTKAYHRRWQKGNGHFCALMRDPQIEQSSVRFFDVPTYLYKQALLDVIGWGKNRVTRNSVEVFLCETRICFFLGFFRCRREMYRRSTNRGTIHEIAAFLSTLFRLSSGKVQR